MNKTFFYNYKFNFLTYKFNSMNNIKYLPIVSIVTYF